ncbi:MAG: DNA polymerase III subunit delta' [Patescibacteria group bacterium]|nr:DNA polymerase III subunit delta' [Patescibacteria group bacterium]
MERKDFRKRPQKDKLIGHGSIFGLLERSFESGRMAHAYLLTGPESVGKVTLAKHFARHLLTENVTLDTHPDYIHVKRGLDPKSGKVRAIIALDQVHDIRSKLSRRALLGGWKICIIDGAQHMNREASNALLKTLEEPQDKTLIILTVPDADSVMPTIMSRCQILPLARVLTTEIKDALVARGIDADQAGTIARLADGCPGQAIRYAEEAGVLIKMKEMRAEILRMADADVAERWQTIEKFLPKKHSFQEAGMRAHEFLDLAAEILRDAMLVRHGNPDSIIHKDVEVSIRGIANDESRDLKGAVAELYMARRRLKENVGPRTVLQSFVLAL